MKKVAGQLRLDLAQFRELEAFAQFATDLDETTRKQIERGRRIVEVLKQGQYKPMDLAHQICVIFAATKGHLDFIATDKVSAWEEGFHSYLNSNAQDLLDLIMKERALTDEVIAGIVKHIEIWSSMFSDVSEAKEPKKEHSTKKKSHENK